MNIEATCQTLAMVLQKTSQNYIVPLFQRNYTWGVKECKVLWTDLENVVRHPNKNHFLGAVVFQDKGISEGLYKALIIDGQQRLITTTLMIAALRDRLKEINPESYRISIYNEFLICPNYKNSGAPVEGFAMRDGYFRIHPTELDKKNYFYILGGKPEKSDQRSPIFNAYRYYKEKFKNYDELKIVDYFNKLVYQMGLVVVYLNRADNPYEVFSSLNNKGTPLTLADLIRNLLFEQIPEDIQKSFYDEYYKPTEDVFEKLKKDLKNKNKRLKANKFHGKAGDPEADYMSEFIYRMWAAHKREIVPQNQLVDSVAEEVKGVEAAREFMERMKIYSVFYAAFVLPDLEAHPGVRKALEDIKRTGETTFYPLLLELFYLRYERKIGDEALVQMIRAIENVVVRRRLYGKEAAGANKEFPRVIAKMEGEPTVKALVKAMLSVGVYPTDAEIMHAAKDEEFYGGGKTDFVRLLLIQLNRSYHKDLGVHYHDAELEHILPQNHDKWLDDLSKDEVEKLKNFPSLVHRLGNLTLVNAAYNKQISNEKFIPHKRDEYKSSPYTLTQKLAELPEFTPTTIENRTVEMLERLLNQVYKDYTAHYGIEIPKLKAAKKKAEKFEVFRVNGEPIALPKLTWKAALIYFVEHIIENHPHTYHAYKQKHPNEFYVTDPYDFRRLSTGDYFRVNMSAKDVKITIDEFRKMAGLAEDYAVFIS